MVAAITTAIRKTFLPSHILVEDKFGLTDPSMIMLEQQRAVNKEELVNYVGHINGPNGSGWWNKLPFRSCSCHFRPRRG